MPPPSLSLTPIGVIRTPFSSRYSAPRQPGTSRRRSVGTITLDAGRNFEQALEDLAGFEYVWILFWFDRNTGWKPKVLPPASDRKKRGVFATRSPHRPNPIGLSLCRLLEVKGRTLKVENPDLLDRTPILDIKPYIPHTESKPGARDGWIGDAHEDTERRFKVTIRRSVVQHVRQKDMRGATEMLDYLRSVLSRDPHPHNYRRIKAAADGTMEIAVKKWRFGYLLRGMKVSVVKCWRADL